MTISAVQELKAATDTSSTLHTLFFNTTRGCNLRCHYCYASSDSARDESVLSLKNIEDLAHDGRVCGATTVILSGGEPFFRKDWKDVFGIFDHAGYTLSISSNGTLVSDNHIQELRRYKRVVFQISLDGSQPTMDRITGIAGSFARINAGICRLRAAGFPVQVNCVLHEDNYEDIPFLLRYAYEKRLFTRFTVISNSYGRAASANGLSIHHLNNVIKAVHIGRSVNPFVELNLPPLLLHPNDWFTISPSCGWVHHQCGVLSNGDVTICGLAIDMPDLVAGNIKDERFYDIWEYAPLFKSLRNLTTDGITGVCRECPFLQYCGGSCRLTPFVTAGDVYAPDGHCQGYHEALKEGAIEENDFPSGVIAAGLMRL